MLDLNPHAEHREAAHIGHHEKLEHLGFGLDPSCQFTLAAEAPAHIDMEMI